MTRVVFTRALSSVVLWTAVLGSLWFFREKGAVALATLLAAFTLLELYHLLAAAGWAPFSKLGTFFGSLVCAAPWLQYQHPQWRGDLLPALAAIVFSIRALGERPPEKRVEALLSTLFGLAYVGLLLQFLVRIVTPTAAISPGGSRLWLCVWIVAVAKFCDVGGLLTGLAVGRHPMAPQISPKKTWEGVGGGIALAMVVGALGARLAGPHFPPGLTPLRAALIAVPIAAAGIVSDLVESAIKRRANIKDSGGLIPGIGGIFDVSDSLLLAAPIGFILLGFR